MPRSIWIPALACAALAALSLLLPSTLTYDPWAWVIWGREVAHLDLTTTAGPSWKPLPVLFTTPFSLAGDAAPWLWLWLARAGGLAAVCVAFVLGRRLAGGVAGAGAAATLAGAPWFIRNVALGNSEGLLVALALGAVLAHVADRRGAALALALGAALLRPEAWPFLGLYAVWLWRAEPGLRRAAIAALAALPVLWFLPELWGSGDLFRAAERARDPNPNAPAFADRPALAVAELWLRMLNPLVLAGGAGALVLAAARAWPGRSRATLVSVASGALGWVAIVALMTERGYSGNSRYLILPAAAACVVGAAGAVRVASLALEGLLRLAAPALGRWGAESAVERAVVGAAPARLRAGIVRRRLRERAARRGMGPGVATALAAGLAALVLVAPELDEIRPELRSLDYQAQLAADLPRAIEQAGGAAALKACGRPYTGPFLVPIVAWRLHVHGVQVALDPRPPAVVLQAAHVRGVRPGPEPPPGSTLAARAGQWAVFRDCRTRRLAERGAVPAGEPADGPRGYRPGG